MKNLKSIIVTTVALTVICVIAATALGFTNKLTASKIAEVDIKAEKEAMTRVIAAAEYREGTVTSDGEKYTYYTATEADGSVLGYVLTTTANGYGGKVKVMVGLDVSGTVAAIEVLDASNETPGLGQNAAKKSFWEQFSGKSGEIKVAKRNPGKDEIQAMTGATITTNAVKNAVNKALSVYSNIATEVGSNG